MGSMPRPAQYDAVIVGAGPNGLSAAITLAKAGHSVLVVEGAEQAGGGLRSAELTLPGFVHDVCSAVQPLGMASPFLRQLPLADHGLSWVQPALPLAHPLDGGRAAVLLRSLPETAASLGHDEGRYRSLLAPLVQDWEGLLDDFLGPLRPPGRPLAMMRFGARALPSASAMNRLFFGEEESRALFAGLAAHAIRPLEGLGTSAFGLMMAMLGHAVGWPMVRGGSQRLADALVTYLRSLGGEVRTGWQVASLDELPLARAVLLDTSPRGLLELAGDRLPDGYRRALRRYRYGPGVFKLDLALSEPLPWAAAACREAGTVHVGGTWQEVAEAERAVWQGRHPERPFVLVAQQSLFDDTRAPDGRHTLWAYCHVPAGSTEDMSEAILGQLERFAPGARDLVLAAHGRHAAAHEAYNPNYVGGDINSGVQDLWQQFTRPVARWDPYSTPSPGLFLCSSATPPGGGVHGMSGHHAGRSALRWLERR